MKDKGINLPFYVKVTIFLVGSFALLAMLYIAQGIVVPIVFAIIIAILLQPVVDFFVRLKINRVVSISITLALMVCILVAFGGFLFSQASHFSESWPILVDKFTLMLDQATHWASGYFDINPHKIDAWLLKTKNELINTSGAAIGQTIVNVGSSLVILFLVPVYIFMILYYQPLLLDFIRKLSAENHQSEVSEIVTQSKSVIQQRLMMLKNQAPSAVDLGTQLQNQVISAKARVEQLRAQGAPADQIKSAEEAVKRQMEALQSARDRGALKLRPLGDLSNGQYGTLGAWALADGGIEMPNAYWKTADRFWRLTQMQDGGWTYPAGRWEWPGSKMSMTLAGVASLYVTGEFTDTELRLTNRPDPAVERALERISREFKANLELYEMYGVERVGLATGLKFFNETNWYEAGAKALLQTQGGDGSWNYRDTVPGTAYALLFLARGRNPVVFNKLEYPGNTWNARPRDNANLTRWMARRFEREINWQVVNLKVQPEEWLDAPILMITGSVDPKFTPQDIAKLRSFVEAGGLIFSTADGDNPEFTKAVRRIAGQLVDGKYELRELPATHPVFNIHTPMKSGEVVNYAPVKMMGLSNGVRELWVHSPTDMGAAWQGRKVAKKECFEVPANLFFYATGKGTLRSKLQPLAVMPSKEKPVRQVTLARVMYNGNWDPEPGAWRRLSKVAQSEFATDLQTKAVEMEKLDAKQTPLAHLTGTVRFSPSAAEVEGLQAFLKAGGTLFVDVMGGGGGGNDAFATSFAELMKQVDPEAKLTLLGEDDPLYKGAFAGGKDCTSVEYRRFSIETYGRRTKPALQAYMIGGRQAVIYSAADVTSGLLGTNTWGILGYAPNSAEDLARNVVLRFGVAAPAAK